MGRPNLSRETEFSGANGDREKVIFNNTRNTSVIKHALVPNGWVGGVVVGWLGGVVVVVVVGGRRQRCILPSGW